MQVFKIRKDRFNEIRNKLLIRTIPLMLITGGVGIVISTVNSKEKGTDFTVLPILIVVVILMFGFSLYRIIKKQRALLESYALTVTDNMISREQLNTPTISIYLNEVKEVVKCSDGSFLVKGIDPADVIPIPPQIEEYEKIELFLQQIQLIIPSQKVSFFRRYPALTGLFTLGLMVSVYLVQNKIVVAVSGTLLITLMIISFVKIRANKNVDNKTKRGAWWILVVLASIIFIMIGKLMA